MKKERGQTGNLYLGGRRRSGTGEKGGWRTENTTLF